jgi:hypothetical protein
MQGDYLISVTTHSIVRYFGSDADPIIPNDVWAVGQSAFESILWVQSIKFPPQCPTPSKLRRIGREAFIFCDILESISFPSSVEHLE